MKKEKYYHTFSIEQKERKVQDDKDIIAHLNKIGIQYLLGKTITYIVNDVTKLDLTGDDEITLKIKQALEEKGLSGIINI